MLMSKIKKGTKRETHLEKKKLFPPLFLKGRQVCMLPPFDQMKKRGGSLGAIKSQFMRPYLLFYIKIHSFKCQTEKILTMH